MECENQKQSHTENQTLRWFVLFTMTKVYLKMLMQPKEYIMLMSVERSVVFKKSSRDAYIITPTCEKAKYTVLATGHAAGEYMSPFKFASI